ncbi:proton-conducting transporter membrane subunit [Macrococcus brunensis]|uniref:proton-conducting transporter transmembrane domain-containing protein n=1 Tax=Macrococcus brunensis TaxID=198483 RepID=UPI001EEFBF56|nr:proton-conducting transporter membrane subunit [Macrococcus brunensis]ULG75125.1 cation:proton antiporter [Macrococcus brunensis]
MNNLILLPLLIPLLAGLVTVLYKPYRREITIIASAVAGVIALTLSFHAVNEMMVINFGGWQSPYGIQFAGDFISLSLSGISLILTSLILMYGLHRPEYENDKLPFILFLLVGVNGSFLTADIFNLFVQFEVMLLASFVLMAIGNRAAQFKASIPYIVINIIGSWIFLAAIAMTYRLYGTLNYAHLSIRVQDHGMSDHAILIALLYLLVFALKSALILFMWLPKSYAVLSTENSAIFSALLTKVGVYAMIRFFTVIFSVHAAVTHEVLLVGSIFTMIIGSIGVLAYRSIKYMICYQIILSIGIILFGLSTHTDAGLQGALLYLMNDMLIKGLLFLVAGIIIRDLHISTVHAHHGAIKQYPLLGTIFLLVTLTIGGVPPFGGFAGKLLIIEGGLHDRSYIGTIVMIIASLIALYTLIRMFLKIFFGEVDKMRTHDIPKHQYGVMVVILILSFCITLFAQPIIDMLSHFDVDQYNQFLIKGDEK